MGPGPFPRKKTEGGAPGTRKVAVRSERQGQGRSALTASVVSGVQSRRREAWETVPKLLETRLQFRFRNFRDLWVSRVGWDSGKRGRPALVLGMRVPLAVQ